MVCYNRPKTVQNEGGGGMYIAICDDQAEELNSLTEPLRAWS